jgi:hypothetical protein
MGQFFVLMLRLYKAYGRESSGDIFINGRNAKESQLSIAIRGLQVRSAPAADDIARMISNTAIGTSSSNAAAAFSVSKPSGGSSKWEFPRVKLMSCMLSPGEKAMKPLTVSNHIQIITNLFGSTVF